MKNIENCKLVLQKIKENPDQWNQGDWHCGTSHCFAGWAQILAGKEANDGTARRDARIFLGLNRHEADYYFSAYRTLDDLETVVEDGYNRAGYDCDCYNRAGYNRAGYDCDGYNRDGYNRAGYDCAGYNRAGYDCDGYDRDGLDCNNNPRP